MDACATAELMDLYWYPVPVVVVADVVAPDVASVPADAVVVAVPEPQSLVPVVWPGTQRLAVVPCGTSDGPESVVDAGTQAVKMRRH